jgi:small GTP-binding protein
MSHNTNKETVVIKVIVLGSANVGKTALIERYCSQKYSSKRNPTIGSDFRTKILEIHDTEVVLQVWDTAVLLKFSCVPLLFL